MNKCSKWMGFDAIDTDYDKRYAIAARMQPYSAVRDYGFADEFTIDARIFFINGEPFDLEVVR